MNELLMAIGTLGAVPLLLDTLGVHPQPLFWALAGGTLGLSMAPNAGRLRTAVVFCCVVLLSGLLGTAGAARYADGSLIAANTIGALSAWLFHPVAGAVVGMVPQIIAGWLQRWSAAPAPAKPDGNPKP